MLGARPGVGQLTFSTNIAFNFAENGLKTLFFSSKANEGAIWGLHSKLFKTLKPENGSKYCDISFAKNAYEMKRRVLLLNQYPKTKVDLIILDYLLFGLPKSRKDEPFHKPYLGDLKDTFISDEDFDTILLLYRELYCFNESFESLQAEQLNEVKLIVSNHKNLITTLNINELTYN